MSIHFPHVLAGDPIRVSATTYATYRRCPAQAGARLQGVYPAETRAGFVGTLAHRVFSRHLSSGPITPEGFVQACREEIGGSGLNGKLGPLGIRPSELAAAIEEVRGLYERFTRFPGEGFRQTEVSLEVVPTEGVELVGTVDAVYSDEVGGVRLVDWKTGELGDPVDQLLYYSLLWTMDRGDPPAQVEAVSVRTGERLDLRPSTDDLTRVAKELGELVDAVRTSWAGGGHLPRIGGPWCRYCPLLEECPEGVAVLDLLH